MSDRECSVKLLRCCRLWLRVLALEEKSLWSWEVVMERPALSRPEEGVGATSIPNVLPGTSSPRPSRS